MCHQNDHVIFKGKTIPKMGYITCLLWVYIITTLLHVHYGYIMGYITCLTHKE